MAKRISVVTHVTRGDVLDDLGFSRSEATALKFKAGASERHPLLLTD